MEDIKSECAYCKHVGLCKYESEHRKFEEELAKLQETFASQNTDWFTTKEIKYFCKHFDTMYLQWVHSNTIRR